MAAKKYVLDDEKIGELIGYLHFVNSKLQKHGYMYMIDPNISYNHVAITRVTLTNYKEDRVFTGNYTGAKNWFKGVCEVVHLF